MKRIKEFSLEQWMVIVIILYAIYASINYVDWYMWIGNLFVGLAYTAGFALTYKRFQFTRFAYIMIFFHVLVILTAAKYTYEQEPLFNFVKEYFGHTRNNFDRLGHFLQGFVPVLLTREMMLRTGYMKKSIFFIIVLVFFSMGMSAVWELLEFVGAFIFKKPEEFIISMQGDFWDAQWDMMMCFIGTLTALLTLSKYQDKLIEE